MLHSFVSFSKGFAENVYEYKENQNTYCLLKKVWSWQWKYLRPC